MGLVNGAADLGAGSFAIRLMSARSRLHWSTGDDEDQVVLRLQSQLMVALPPPHDVVSVDLKPAKGGDGVGVEMRIVRRREARALGST
ncbi:phospholipase A I-like [Lolium perenne]|uniref:phospholipase A I-like n=1 Tax=Lolium perenne TaxID=4522 RepID=UPI0021EB4833